MAKKSNKKKVTKTKTKKADEITNDLYMPFEEALQLIANPDKKDK